MADPIRIAVDIGGTFTDVQILNESSGRSFAHKTPTTPQDPSIGLMQGIKEASERFDFAIDDVSALMHGTTIATNAVLERRFPKAALITTRGFEDVLEIGRHVRTDVYSQVAEERPLFIPRRHRFGVNERVNARGDIESPLDVQDAGTVIAEIAAQEINVVAICLLHSFSNTAHEDTLCALVESAIPGSYVSVSSRTSPQAREFERSSTTVLNALLMPIVRDYLDRLHTRLAENAFNAPVFLVQSNGGVTTPDIAREQPVRLVLSGPSGGARAAEVLSARLSEPNLVAIDMGGTSFDVSVVENGATRARSEGDVDGAPVRLPMLEIRTIGSGGGSLASADSAGRLTVGPKSAGADPGPVAYGRGGTEPTVTDANLVLGRIDPAYFLGGAMSLDVDAARSAVDQRVASPLSLGIDEAAEGIIQIAVSDMAEAIRLSLFEKGLDPLDFALTSFGGAGGLHAALVADELGAKRILYPLASGTLSAWGMLFADIVQDVVRSRLVPADASGSSVLAPILVDLMHQGESLLDRTGVESDRRDFSLGLDMRYPGQGWEIGVDAPDVSVDEACLLEAGERFHRAHETLFAHAERDSTPEVVALRLRASGQLDKPLSVDHEPDSGSATKPTRRAFTGGAWYELPVFDRAAMAIGATVVGPCLVEESHSTILLTEGWTASVHPSGVLSADRQ